jgi:agmatine deiminase
MNSTGKMCRELGYSMPAEWQKHDAIWLSWPYDPTTFPDRVDKVEVTYVQIVKEIHEGEQVNLFVTDEGTKEKAIRLFKEANIDLNKINFYVFDYADVWFRDYGPIFVKNQSHELAMLHWNFNSWGEKYEELLKDKQIPEIINRKMALKCFKPGIVLEGGSIDVNGEGTLLTTEQCLLNKNRNPHLDRSKSKNSSLTTWVLTILFGSKKESRETTQTATSTI